MTVLVRRAQLSPRHPEVLASSASLEGRRPGLHLGRSSFEAPGAMLCIAPLAPPAITAAPLRRD